MKRRSTKRRDTPRQARTGASGSIREWVGARLTGPFYVTEPAPYRPEVILWLELPDDVVIGCQLIDPAGPPVSFEESLRRTMQAPMIGPPRRPVRIRVPEQQLADQIRQVVSDTEIVIAPVPELDDLLRLMSETMPGDDNGEPSYFEDGRVPVAAIDDLFAAAAVLFQVAPWQTAADSQVLRLDIPELDVTAACLSIIGQLGESLGFIIFPSLKGFESFLDTAEQFADESLAPHTADLGSSMLSLNFERGADLPATMRREAAEHGWPVTAANAYPRVQHLDRDAVMRPLSERDVRIVSACASALAAFSIKHGALFTEESFEPVCESWSDRHNLEVRFTIPYEAGSLFAVNDPGPAVRRATPKVGRNMPCPCGSGRKHKNCCLRR